MPKGHQGPLSGPRWQIKHPEQVLEWPRLVGMGGRAKSGTARYALPAAWLHTDTKNFGLILLFYGMENIPCFECGKPAAHNHHVIPRVLGGTRTVPLCLECHSLVHNHDFVKHRELQRAGIAAAREANGGRCPWGGGKFGRRSKCKPETVAAVKRLHQGGETISAIARVTGLSRVTVYAALRIDS